MKKILFSLFILIAITTIKCFAQYSGSFVVQGNIANYYPVLFQDLSWSNNKATEFEIGRSNVHTDANWRGSLISRFRIHTTDWGHGSNFIDADIRQLNPPGGSTTNFIAGWDDATTANGNSLVIIWFKGGGTTYYFNAATNITPVVYDGVAHALPYAEPNGPVRTYKTAIDAYVNSNGLSAYGTAFYRGAGNNYFAGNIGIGTTSPDQALTVNGTVHSKAVVVNNSIFPDYVFNKTYALRPLSAVKTYIDLNHHLPEIPSAAEVAKNGQNLGEINTLLLKKVEELTLYLIDEHKTNERLQAQMSGLKSQMKLLVKKGKK